MLASSILQTENANNNQNRKICRKSLYLNPVLPLASVRLTLVKPAHSALAMPHIVHPHALVDIPRRIMTHTPAELPIVDPVTLKERRSFSVVDHLAFAVPLAAYPLAHVHVGRETGAERAQAMTLSLEHFALVRRIAMLIARPQVLARAHYFIVQKVALVDDATRPYVHAFSGHHSIVKLALFLSNFIKNTFM